MNASVDVLPLVEEVVARHNSVYEMHGEWLGMYAYWNGQPPDMPLPLLLALIQDPEGKSPNAYVQDG